MVLEGKIKEVAQSQKELITNHKGVIREELANMIVQDFFVTIISGIRRCGKSTLLAQMLQKEPDKVFFINFEDPRLFDFERNDFERLDRVIVESDCKNLFFDEIQIVPEWERYVRQKLDEKFRVVVTGSNASLLSKELGTKLTGRNLQRELFPFSFEEFCRFTKKTPSTETANKYLHLGGFPEYLASRNQEVLQRLLIDILTRDIAVRYGIRDFRTLQRLALYLLTNVGKLVSGGKLKTQFEVGATSTVLEYMSHLETSYLLFFVRKFSYSLRKQDVNPRKVYAIDTGLVKANSLSFSEDIGRKFENLVYLHLRRKFEEIYYFAEKGECDFVVFQKGQISLCVQVCYDLNNDNLQREMSGLIEALDFFNLSEGTIVTFSQKDKIEKNGKVLNVVPAWEFLTKPFHC